MDQKTWLWRKRSSEKTIVANGEEERSVPMKKEVDLETSLKELNEKLASVVDECSAKDIVLQSLKQMVDDSMTDRNRAEEEAGRLRKELDQVLEERVSANEGLSHLNAALKDCMEQLNLTREEQEKRVQDAVVKTSQEFEKAHKKLEEKLSEMSKRLASAAAENSYLNKAILGKEQLIVDLNHTKNRTEAEFEALMSRLDSTEKENAFLRYEFRTIEKELELRNEEVEYCRRSAEVSNKQHLENVKKIKRLEADCQRLRGLTRKRMPGQSILANMKTDMELQVGSRFDGRRKAMPGRDVPSGPVYSPDNANKKIGLLVSQLHDLEKENEILREFLVKKEEEILHYQNVKNLELTISSHSPGGTVDSKDVASSPFSEEKHGGKFRDRQTEHECRMIGASDMSLMDDFIEMEKLAIVAVDVPLGASFCASDVSRSLSNCSKENSDNHLNSMSKELVLVGNGSCSGKPSDWLRNVIDVILEQHGISKRSIEELIGDVRMALNNIVCQESSKLLPVSGYITWKSPASTPRSNSIQEPSNVFQQSDVNTSLGKIIELVGKFDLPYSEDCNPQEDLLQSKKALPKVTDSKIHVFRWKSCELTSVIKDFLCSCNDLLRGNIGYENFIAVLASTLGWIARSSTSCEDHLTVRDEFRKHLGGDGPGTALELECIQNLMVEMEKMHSVLQVEIKGLKNELNWIKLSNNDPEMVHKLQQSQEIITCLQNELDCLKESRRMSGDQLENLKVINEDLDTELTVTKSKLNEVLQKLSCTEVELDNKTHCCEELEGTCLELQLQLESMSNNHYKQENGNHEELLQTGMEITKASAKLAECEETILKLGTQLKSLGSAKELSVVDKVLSMTGTTTKKLKQRSSLREQMLSEDSKAHLKFSREMASMTDTNGPSSVSRTSSRNFSFSDGTMDKYLRTKRDSRTTKSGALVIVPTKKRKGGGIGLLTKLLLRRNKGSSKNNKNASLW